MATNNNKKLFTNFIALSIVQGTNFLLPLLVMPFVIKRIGADGFGVVAVAQVVMIYISTLSDYGFNLTATRDVALFNQDHQKTSQIFFTVLSSKLMITIVSFLVLLVAAVFIPFLKQHFILYLLGFTYVIGQSLLVSWFFQGVEKMHYITISTLISRLVFVALVLLFIHEKKDAVFFLFFLGIGNVIAGIVSIFIAVRIFRLKFLVPHKADIVHELRSGWEITVTNLSINTYLYSGIFILRIFTNDLIVGYYGIAEKIFFAVRQVLAVFSQVVYPRICQLTIQGKKASTLFFKSIYLPFLILTVAGCTLLFIFSPEIVYIFVKDGEHLPVVALRILSFVPVIVCLNIPAYQLLIAFNRKKSYLVIFTVAIIINIIVNILLVEKLGAKGTALSLLLTELFITVALNIELFRNNLDGFVTEPAHDQY
ncbi:MAG: oligosaccharide flippase family protein [Ferruginibacter sp.]